MYIKMQRNMESKQVPNICALISICTALYYSKIIDGVSCSGIVALSHVLAVDIDFSKQMIRCKYETSQLGDHVGYESCYSIYVEDTGYTVYVHYGHLISS